MLHYPSMLKIKELVWDSWNVRHIKKHQVSAAEVEEACRRILKALKTYQDRLIVIGKVEKRLLTVVLSPRGKGKYYVVTAQNASRKERRLVK